MFLITKDNNSNRLKYTTENTELDSFIKTAYSTPNPATKYSPYAPAMLSAISPGGLFMSGLCIDILKLVKSTFPTETIKVDPKVFPIIKPFSINTDNILELPNDNIVLRDYQKDAMVIALKHMRGTIRMATSAGKSATITGIIHNIWNLHDKLQVLIVVPNIQLVTQFYNDILEYGIAKDDISMFSSFDNKPKNTKLIISNRDWLQEGHYRKLPEPEVIFIDECQQLKKTSEISKLISQYKTNCKFAFTATLPDKIDDVWNVLGLAGPVLYEIDPHELQALSAIADTNITSICIDHGVPQPELEDSDDAFERAKARFKLEWNFIESNELSNRAIAKKCCSLVGNSIVLFDHTAHGKLIQTYCEEYKQSGYTIHFINGNTDIKERDAIKHMFETSDNNILVGQTKCVGTGLSIKNIINVCFAFTAGTATCKILQIIGRGLRLKHGKKEMFLYDFYHNFKYSKQHFDVRKVLYSENYTIKTYKKELIVL